MHYHSQVLPSKKASLKGGFVNRKLIGWDKENQATSSSELRPKGSKHQRSLPTTNSR